MFNICLEQKKELNKTLGVLARKAIDQEKYRFRFRESFLRNSLKDPNEEYTYFGGP